MRKQDENKTPLQKLGYETSDIPIRAIVMGIIGLFIFLGASTAVSFGFYYIFAPKDPIEEAPPTAAGMRLPPEDYRIQGYPLQDMERFRENEETAVNAYVWKDKARGTVQIPLDRAVELIAERGFPTRTGPGMSQEEFRRRSEQAQREGGALPPPNSGIRPTPGNTRTPGTEVPAGGQTQNAGPNSGGSGVGAPQGGAGAPAGNH